MTKPDSRRYAPYLAALLALFAFRVVAQPLQFVLGLPFLPAYDAWHSGRLPYGLLVVFQVLILVLMLRITLSFRRSTVRPRRRSGWIILGFGAVYFAVMSARLALGLTWLADHDWFGKPVPAFFHLVLAAFVITVGLFHLRGGERKA